MSAKGASSHSAAAILDQIRQKILNDHNKYRKLHHVPPLKLHDALTRIAQDWSDQLLEARTLRHRPATKFGENLWTGSGFTIDDMLTNEKANPVSSWYAEIKNYPDANFEKWGHFTQMIWKGSKYLGCGISYEADIIFVVCDYDPPGNWRNKYHDNVFTVEGAPWSNEVPENDGTADGSKTGKRGKTAGGGGGGGGSSEEDDGLPGFIGNEEREEQSTPYWMYGLGFVIILLVVVLLAILIYYQKS